MRLEYRTKRTFKRDSHAAYSLLSMTHKYYWDGNVQCVADPLCNMICIKWKPVFSGIVHLYFDHIRGLAITVCILIWETLNSNLCRDTKYPNKIFVVFLCSFSKMPGYNLSCTTTASSQIPSR
jgi:hypothetical protein